MSELYTKAKQLLYAEYHKNLAAVNGDNYSQLYMNEKIKHSLQVAGAGNGILKNEPCFQNRSAAFLEVAKTAILLHDIFRFQEIKIRHETGQRVDHGVEGAVFLQSLSDFNQPLITLPVKHHGHMIEEFYQDPEYQNIPDKTLRQDIEQILFAVRDADKIANWYLMNNEFDFVKNVWLPYPDNTSKEQGIISDDIWNIFANHGIVRNGMTKTNAEELISAYCWLFDINYLSSIRYCHRLNLFNKFLNLFEFLQVPANKINSIKNIVADYIQKRFNYKL